jgi:hypothetical protein
MEQYLWYNSIEDDMFISDQDRMKLEIGTYREKRRQETRNDRIATN